MKHTLINKSVLDALKELPDESVDCIVSSPPYFGLRSYKNADTIWGGKPKCEHEWISQKTYKDNLRFRDPNHIASVGNNKNTEIYSNPEVIGGICSKCGAWKGQLGLEPSYEMYLDHMLMVMKELKRVLKKTGTLFWNMGDSYVGGHPGGSIYNKEWNISKADAIPQIKEGRPQAHVEGISEKSLMMIPERLAIAMIDERDGFLNKLANILLHKKTEKWVLRNKIVWHKKNGLPSSVSDRFSNKWEYVFFFTKAKRYYFDLDSVRKPLAESSIKRILQKTIPNQFKKGKSVDFAETDPVNNIPKILNNMHKKYEKDNAEHSTRLTANKQFFNQKGQGGNVDYNGIDSENGNHYHPNGANPGDVINTPAVRHKSWASNPGHEFTHDRKYDPDADGGDFLDIPTRPHKFAHFAAFPETLVEPLIKAGCPSEVCVKCGKPKILSYSRREKTGNEKPITGKHVTNPEVNSPGNREHYYTEVRKYDVNQKEIASFIKEHLSKEKMPILDDKFGETKWKHWIRTDESGASLPSPSEYAELKEILALPDDHDEEMLSTVTVLVDDSGNSNIPIGLKPSCNCNAGFKPGVVLDPFAGSGTVGVVSQKLGRSSILIEISPEYCKIIKERLNWNNGLDVEYEEIS